MGSEKRCYSDNDCESDSTCSIPKLRQVKVTLRVGPGIDYNCCRLLEKFRGGNDRSIDYIMQSISSR